MKERRRDPRVALRLEVRWDGLSGNYRAVTSDISLSGCYVETLASMTVGGHLRFDIKLPVGRWFQLCGEVLYQHPTVGFGLRFADLTDWQQSELALLINYTLATQPPTVELTKAAHR